MPCFTIYPRDNHDPLIDARDRTYHIVMPWISKRSSRPELLDLPHDSYACDELEGVLNDLTLVNSHFGNGRAVLKHLAAMNAETANEGFTVLDVATGTADIPVTIAKWARQAGIRVGITAVDLDPLSINIARKRTGPYPEITLAVADGFALPFASQRFDYVLCSKTTHHFTDEKVLQMIKEFSRVARRGYVIVDLRRSWIAYILIFLLTTSLQQEPPGPERRAAFRAEVVHPRGTCRACLKERDFRFQGVQGTVLAHRPRGKGDMKFPVQSAKGFVMSTQGRTRSSSARSCSPADAANPAPGCRTRFPLISPRSR